MATYGPWRTYVPAAQRQRKAAQEAARRQAKGDNVSPVIVAGRAIATTFWGKAWCDNLESYSDYANRLPRGRTYVRNGSVIDLKIEPGAIVALVSGSSLYKVKLHIEPVPQVRWKSICADCTGAIDSLVELLRGRFSQGVMERICRQGAGLFPSPNEIKLSCSCPDWADMCKHVAAVLYGVGARLDRQPELLFRLRQVNEAEMVAGAANAAPRAGAGVASSSAKVLRGADLSALFGLDINMEAEPAPARKIAVKRKRDGK